MMKSTDTARPSSSREEASHSQMYLPDIPLPTPPPMANIMVTSKFDLPTRGGCGYRRILSSRSIEFRSPILSRTNLSQTQSYRSPLTTRRLGSEKDFDPPITNKIEQDYRNPLPARRSIPEHDYRTLISTGRRTSESAPSESPVISPLYRNRNFEDLSRTTDAHQFRRIPDQDISTPRSQCLSTDSVFSQEIDEVDSISSEIRNRTSESYSNELSPDYQNVFYNEHYISDIDENEEIKEFACAYNIPERRLSDHSEAKNSPNIKYFNSNTLPSKHYSFPIDARRSYESNSSMKSSDYYVSQEHYRKSMNSINMFGNAVIKSPCRPIVKIAKIR